MRSKRIALGLAIVALVMFIAPSVFAHHVIYYSPGYWKHNVTVYVEGQGDYNSDYRGIKESDDSMECYEAWIRANIEPDFTLEWAYEAFWMKGSGAQQVKKGLANWFNMAKAACMNG
ncbi:MAG: hypothetical protein JSV51_08570 [Candidatus Bathyarchaeota archaeon]|nr:MAG: hypothetical protein JSV51_08570 [Candidatus Bathyarchaeota archaeon]